MSAEEKLTLTLPSDLVESLSFLVDQSGRSIHEVATIALRRFVDEELPIFEGIQAGLDDVAAGRTISHEDAMAELRAHIETVARRNAEAA